MRLTVLSAGSSAVHLVHSVRQHLDSCGVAPTDAQTDEPRDDVDLTVIAGTARDVTLFGLRICPDIDALCDALARPGAPGSRSRSTHVYDELVRLDAAPGWFPIEDRHFARHIARSRWLGLGLSLSEVTGRLTPESLLPMTDHPVETHVVLGGSSPRAVHVLEWISLLGHPPIDRVSVAGLDRAVPAPGVLQAVRDADAVIVPLSDPVTGLGVMLALPGLREAVRDTSAPVIGVSPTLLPVEGHERAGLSCLDVEFSTGGVAGLFADLLDALVLPRGEIAEDLTADLRIDVLGEANEDDVGEVVLELARLVTSA